MTELIVFYTTWPNEEAAAAAARTLLEERIIACANILPGRSLYRWQGAIEEAGEAIMILKTQAGLAASVRARIAALHPYDIPAIIGLAAIPDAIHPPYADWIANETRS